MRRFVLWLLLALLPWRLWAADAMAWQPCAAAAVAVHDRGHGLHAAPAHAADAHAPTAIEALHAAHDSAVLDAQSPSHGSHAACTSCDICHNPPLTSAPTRITGADTPQVWPLTQSRWPPTTAFAPPLKPPIA